MKQFQSRLSGISAYKSTKFHRNEHRSGEYLYLDFTVFARNKVKVRNRFHSHDWQTVMCLWFIALSECACDRFYTQTLTKILFAIVENVQYRSRDKIRNQIVGCRVYITIRIKLFEFVIGPAWKVVWFLSVIRTKTVIRTTRVFEELYKSHWIYVLVALCSS